MNCEAYSAFDGESYDHRIVTTKLHLNIRRNKTQIAKTTH